MASPSSIAGNILDSLPAALGYLVLERDVEGSFHTVGAVPTWVHPLFPRLEGGDRTIRLAELGLPMLEALMCEFEEVWMGRRSEPADSGPLITQDSAGLEWCIEAWSLRLGGEKLLVLQARELAKDAGRRMMQRVREQDLERIRLEKESQKRDLLIQTIVHDLKVPAMALLNFVQLLAVSRLDPGRLEEMKASLERLCEKQLGMISEILETFRGEAGVMEAFDPDPTRAPDATDCARAACEFFRPGRRRVDVRLVAPPNACLVAAERQRLMRVFLNLIENAVRVSPADSAVIVSVLDEGHWIRCDVEDHGPGVEPEMVPSLFQKFSRGRSSGGSIGLGLYFSRLMVERWGGTIGYRAREGGGAIFWFRLRKLSLGAGR